MDSAFNLSQLVCPSPIHTPPSLPPPAPNSTPLPTQPTSPFSNASSQTVTDSKTMSLQQCSTDSSQNSDDSNPSLENPSLPAGTSPILPTSLLNASSNDATLTSEERTEVARALFLDLPLDSLMDLNPAEMCPEALTAYVQRCSVLRASAQTRKAALTKEAGSLGAKKKATKKDNAALALDLLKQLVQKKG